MKQIKQLSELNKLTVWYVISALGFMGWYVALLIKDYTFFAAPPKSWRVNFYLVILHKLALTGKDAFDISFEVGQASF